MKHIVVIHENVWFKERHREIASWPNVSVIDPLECDYRERYNPDVHYHIWAQEEWFAALSRVPTARACRMTLRYVEQIPVDDDDGDLSFAQRLWFRFLLKHAGLFDQVYVSTTGSWNTLRRMRPDLADRIVQNPIGYTRHFGAPDFGCDQDIDVLIYGLATERRKRILGELSPRLSGLNVVAMTRCWGEERNDLIRRTKILLHIQSAPRLFPAMRMWRALANGAFWLTEEVGDPYPAVAGEHFAEVPTITSDNADAVGKAIYDWLVRPSDRDRIRRRGCDHVIKLPMTHYFETLRRGVEALPPRTTSVPPVPR